MSLAGIVGGLIGSGQKLPTIDIGPLLATIQNAGTYQKDIINALPAQIQAQLAEYQKQNQAAGTTLQNNVTNQGNDYMAKMAGVYGPDSPAAKAAMDAARTQIYSTVPGTQDAIRGAMAATGGLSRGHAGAALAQPYVQAAGQYGQTASNIVAGQAGKAQDATAGALQVVNSMNDQMFSQLFGMSREQAQQILTTGNQALRDQLSQLLTQSTNQTNQTLGLQGISAQNGYNNAVERNAQQGQIWNGVAGLATGPLDNMINGASQSLSPQQIMQMFGGGGAGMGAVGSANAAGSSLLPPALSLIA